MCIFFLTKLFSLLLFIEFAGYNIYKIKTRTVVNYCSYFALISKKIETTILFCYNKRSGIKYGFPVGHFVIVCAGNQLSNRYFISGL